MRRLINLANDPKGRQWLTCVTINDLKILAKEVFGRGQEKSKLLHSGATFDSVQLVDNVLWCFGLQRFMGSNPLCVMALAASGEARNLITA